MNSRMDCGIAVETGRGMANWMERGMVEGWIEGWIDDEQGSGKENK